MNTSIALLRGINVSGQKKIRMADLRGLLKASGFQNVQTYIQSGNIIIQDPRHTPSEIEAKIKKAILGEYGFEVHTIVRTIDEWEQVIANNPFAGDNKYELKKMYVTFLSASPDPSLLHQLEEVDQDEERFTVHGQTIYLYYSNGYGRAKMNNNFFEKKLECPATTRNWKTVNKLWSMAQN